MKRKNSFITVLLILLCVVGAVGAVTFLRQEQELEQKRQQEVAWLSEQLQPLNAERRQWEEKDKEWQNRLTEKQKGRSCILLNFDNMSENLYDTIYEMMEQYGFRGTLAFRNGRLPGRNEDDLDREEFDEMMFSGWEYALSFGEEKETEEEVGYWERKEESEAETEIQTEAQEDQQEANSYLEQLDNYIAKLQENGVTVPNILFCDKEQYSEVTEEALAQRGLTMICVKDEEEFPTIGEREDQIWRIDCGIYSQKDSDVEDILDKAVANGQSVAIFINDVHKVSKDTAYDLSLTKFTSLLNYLKGLEEDGKIYLLTYSELAQYEEQQDQEYEELLKQYSAFRREKEEAEAELNRQETELVESLMETEASSNVQTEKESRPGDTAEQE